jgi:predicted nucleotidyltransferase
VIEKESIIKIIQDYLQAIRQAGIHVSHAVLYGSWARSEAGPESDIDLIVIAPEFDNLRDRELIDRLWELTAFVPEAWRIEPIACGEREWVEDDSRAITEIARREGEVITLKPETV